MVEFNFELRSLFSDDILKITSSDFNWSTNCDDDEQQLNQNKLAQLEMIINHMGKLSAAAQNLKAPITTAERLKFSDNTKLYLIASPQDQVGKDAVVGLLKVGKKDLYLYDEMKQQRKVAQVPCILDFYVFESCQRSGYGKRLFEKMLQEENLKPNKCSIDRPSEKLKGFLKKHYGLEKTIPQGYKFVLYKGFFDDRNDKNEITIDKEEYPSNNIIPSHGNRFANAKPMEYNPRQTSISAEHFGAGLDVYSIGRCNRKFPKHCVTECPYSMVEVMQTLNSKRC